MSNSFVGAVFLSVLILLALSVNFVWLIVPPFVEQFQQLLVLLPQGLNQAEDWLNLLSDRILGTYLPDVPDINSLVQRLQPLLIQWLGRSINFFTISISVVLQLVLVLALSIMLLASP